MVSLDWETLLHVSVSKCGFMKTASAGRRLIGGAAP